METLRRSRTSTTVTANGEVQTHEEAHVFCFRSWSLRDSAISRGHACSFIAWKPLRRARLYLWVDQRSKATPDQTRTEDDVKDGKLRAHCYPGIVVKIRRKFVFYIDTAGLIKYFFKCSNAKWRWGTRELAPFTENPRNEECRSASNRTHFSWLRFGTSYKSGIQETQYLHALPKRPKLRRLLANQDDKGSLQETHWRSFTSCRCWWQDDSRSGSP